MKQVLTYFISFLLWLPATGQNEIINKYAATITQEDLKGLLTVIASDALEGRETGTRGQKMAAAFIAEEFKQIGLEPVVTKGGERSYLQKFKLENYAAESIYLQARDNRFTLKNNILYSGHHNMDQAVSREIIIVSRKHNFDNLNLKNKLCMVIALNTGKKEQEALAKKAYRQGASMVILIPFATIDGFNKYRRSEGRNYARTRYAFEQKEIDGLSNGYFLVSPDIIKSILGIEPDELDDLLSENAPNRLIKKINDKKVSLTYITSYPAAVIETENVLGYLEGSDKKDELVIITAHYDHIGKRGDQINNGADDDGSGTSAVIEMAEAFAKAKADGHGPRRSILFMTVTGEEKGLIGSQYYTNHPVFPLANTVVDLNLDMVGRHDEAHKDNRNFVYLVGSDRLSSELHDLSEKVNSTYTHITLDYTYNDTSHPDRIYYRSDHWNFAKNNIPIIFYFNGIHEDYHRPTDTVDKIEFDMLQKRTQLVYYTAWVIANREQRLVVDKIKDSIIDTNR